MVYNESAVAPGTGGQRLALVTQDSSGGFYAQAVIDCAMYVQ